MGSLATMDDGDESASTAETFEGLRSPRLVAFGHLLEGSQRLLALLEADLKASAAMSTSELEVLLRLANSPHHRARPSELAHQCVMTSGGTTRLLDRLESQGVIQREPHPTDRRGCVVRLTDVGAERLAAVLPGHFSSLERHFWSVLSDEEIQALSDIMRKVRDANR